jgi:SAM-dependent methyltransferase
MFPLSWRRNVHPSPTADSAIIRYRKSQSGSRLLDLGCGDGERAIALAGRSFDQVTGLDRTQSLIDLAIQRAARRRVDVTFVCGDPCATPFTTGSFDEVMLLGGLFGHSGTAKSDVMLLREAGRVLRPGGRLHVSFSDADWIRANYQAEVVEGLPTGFIYRHRALSGDGHMLRTEVLSSGEETGIARHETVIEQLYSPRDMTDLLYRLGFDAITYDAEIGRRSPAHARPAVPQHVVHCKAGRAGNRLRLVP